MKCGIDSSKHRTIPFTFYVYCVQREKEYETSKNRYSKRERDTERKRKVSSPPQYYYWYLQKANYRIKSYIYHKCMYNNHINTVCGRCLNAVWNQRDLPIIQCCTYICFFSRNFITHIFVVFGCWFDTVFSFCVMCMHWFCFFISSIIHGKFKNKKSN